MKAPNANAKGANVRISFVTKDVTKGTDKAMIAQVRAVLKKGAAATQQGGGSSNRPSSAPAQVCVGMRPSVTRPFYVTAPGLTVIMFVYCYWLRLAVLYRSPTSSRSRAATARSEPCCVSEPCRVRSEWMESLWCHHKI